MHWKVVLVHSRGMFLKTSPSWLLVSCRACIISSRPAGKSVVVFVLQLRQTCLWLSVVSPALSLCTSWLFFFFNLENLHNFKVWASSDINSIFMWSQSKIDLVQGPIDCGLDCSLVPTTTVQEVLSLSPPYRWGHRLPEVSFCPKMQLEIA